MVNTIFDFSTSSLNVERIDDTTVKFNGAGFIRTNTFKESGKYYFEFLIMSNKGTMGICSDEVLQSYPGSTSTSYGINAHNNNWWNNASSVSIPNWTIKNNDIAGFCIDLDNKKIQLYINGTFIAEKDILNITDKCFICVGGTSAGTGGIYQVLTNEEDIKYANSYPTGYRAWGNIYNFLLKQSNQYYTFNGSNITLSPSQELNQDNFKNNGFSNPSDITEEQWNNAFPDKTGLKLLMWTDDLDIAEIKAECEIEPYTPYDKLENEFEICMAMDKETI